MKILHREIKNCGSCPCRISEELMRNDWCSVDTSGKIQIRILDIIHENCPLPDKVEQEDVRFERKRLGSFNDEDYTDNCG